MKWPLPTFEVERIIRVIGPEATLTLIEARSAARLSVARFVQPQDDLAQVIGLDAAQRLSDVLKCNVLKVPVARQWRVLVYHARGCTYADIARTVGCSQNTVWRILTKHRAIGYQLDLFDDRRSAPTMGGDPTQGA